MFEAILKKFLGICKTIAFIVALGTLAMIAMYVGLKVQ